MPIRNSGQSYGSVAKAFHWVIFLLITGLIAVGFIMTDMDNTPDKFKMYGLHKSIGVIVLVLAAMRLAWKAINTRPELPAAMHKLEKLAVHIGHAALYALMFAMPLTGWAMSSAAGYPVSLFGWVTLPDLVPADSATKDFMREMHGLLAWALIVMVGLHATAALCHHFYYKNNILRRMLPFIKEKRNALDADTSIGC